MAVLGTLLGLLALTWSAASAFPGFSYPEDHRGARIVSGWEATEGQFPYQLSIRMVDPTGGVSACGASVIHSEWALTAAHCTARRVSIVIRAGAVNLQRPQLLFETTEYINHPRFIEALPTVQPDDIGVIKYNRVIEFTDLVKPIRIQSSADKNKDYSGVRLHTSGWGRTWTNGPSPVNLNWVFLRGTSNLECFMAYGGSPIIVDSTICGAYYNVTSQSTCQGDSGGPLVTYDEDGIETQVGVTSFVSSSGCHTPFPAGFVRPGHYHEWLLEVTGIDFDWEPETPTTTTAAPTEEPETEEEEGPEEEEPEEEESEEEESEESESESESEESEESRESRESDESDESRPRKNPLSQENKEFK